MGLRGWYRVGVLAAAVALLSGGVLWLTGGRRANWPELKPAPAATSAAVIRVGTNVHVSSANATTDHMGCALAADPTDPLRLFAASTLGDTYDDVAGYYSHDGGRTWHLGCRPAPGRRAGLGRGRRVRARRRAAFRQHAHAEGDAGQPPVRDRGRGRHRLRLLPGRRQDVGGEGVGPALRRPALPHGRRHGRPAPRPRLRSCDRRGADRLDLRGRGQVLLAGGAAGAGGPVDAAEQSGGAGGRDGAGGVRRVRHRVGRTPGVAAVALPPTAGGRSHESRRTWPAAGNTRGSSRRPSSACFTRAWRSTPAAHAFAGRLYCVWRDGHASDETYVLLSSSRNSGASWSAPVVVSEQLAGASTGPDYAADVPAVVVNKDGTVAVSWYDRAGLPGHVVGPGGVIRRRRGTTAAGCASRSTAGRRGSRACSSTRSRCAGTSKTPAIGPALPPPPTVAFTPRGSATRPASARSGRPRSRSAMVVRTAPACRACGG